MATAAERVKRYRDRRRRGVVAVSVEVDATTVCALMMKGHLAPGEMPSSLSPIINKDALADALQAMTDSWGHEVFETVGPQFVATLERLDAAPASAG